MSPFLWYLAGVTALILGASALMARRLEPLDIAERKQAERMESDFVSFVSHQLRTPLAGMSWLLELAADSPELPETSKSYRADNAVSIEAEGTGLGLHLVRLIVEQAGRVWCESEEGRGATFAFTLPTIVEQGDRR